MEYRVAVSTAVDAMSPCRCAGRVTRWPRRRSRRSAHASATSEPGTYLNVEVGAARMLVEGQAYFAQPRETSASANVSTSRAARRGTQGQRAMRSAPTRRLPRGERVPRPRGVGRAPSCRARHARAVEPVIQRTSFHRAAANRLLGNLQLAWSPQQLADPAHENRSPVAA